MEHTTLIYHRYMGPKSPEPVAQTSAPRAIHGRRSAVFKGAPFAALIACPATIRSFHAAPARFSARPAKGRVTDRGRFFPPRPLPSARHFGRHYSISDSWAWQRVPRRTDLRAWTFHGKSSAFRRFRSLFEDNGLDYSFRGNYTKFRGVWRSYSSPKRRCKL